MKKMLGIKMVAIPLVISLCGVFAACQGESKPKDEKIVVGISQIIEHAALDESRKGFVDALATAGYKDGENITIDYQNAQGDQSNLKTISQKFAESKANLIYAIATPSAQSAAAETKEIPIVISCVTDPVAAGIVKSNEKPETNVTGASDLTPVKKQIELLKKVVPGAKTIGIIYNSSEVNSEIQVTMAKEAATALGLTCEVATIASANDITQVAESMFTKIDALYVPTDNLVVSAMPLLSKMAIENKIPLISGEGDSVKAGALITDGIDYYNLGKLAGDMAVKILKGESTPKDMPIEYLQDTAITVNKTTAEKLGIEIPADIMDKATVVESKN